MSNMAKQLIVEKDTVYELDQDCLNRKRRKTRQAVQIREASTHTDNGDRKKGTN